MKVDLARMLKDVIDVALQYYEDVSTFKVADREIEMGLDKLDRMVEEVRKSSFPLTLTRPVRLEGKSEVKSVEHAFTREEGAEYTKRMALEHLVAAEDHLRSTAVGKDVKLCVTCMLENHLPALAMYAKEGKKFCRTPEECRAYEMLGEKVEKVRGEIKKVLEVKDEGERRKLLEEMAEELRAPRKLLSPAREALTRVKEGVKPPKVIESFCEKVGDEKCNEIFEKVGKGEISSEEAVKQLKELLDAKGYTKEQVRELIRESVKEGVERERCPVCERVSFSKLVKNVSEKISKKSGEALEKAARGEITPEEAMKIIRSEGEKKGITGEEVDKIIRESMR